MKSISLTLIKKADKYYRQWFNKTPIEYSKTLSDHLQTPVIFKLENLHVSGSYKLRCAHFAFSFLSEKEKRAGLAIASTGYFGLAFAYICYMHNVECHVFVPNTLEESMKEKILGYKAFVHLLPSTHSLEGAAKEIADKKQLTFIKTKSQLSFMASGGALVKEILEDVPQLATLIMPYSDFGLLNGAKYYLSHLDSGYNIIASANSSIKPPAQDRPYDQLMTASSSDIKKAMQWFLYNHQLLVDLKGATALAVLLKKSPPKLNGPVCVVITGRYVDKKTLKTLL